VTPERKRGGLVPSFHYAGAGLWWALKTQRNLRIHIGLGTLATLLGLLLGFSTLEFAVLVVTMTLVITLELVNTAVDLASPDYHPLAKVAKDVAAGAVLASAIGAVLIGLLLFLPRLLHHVP